MRFRIFLILILMLTAAPGVTIEQASAQDDYDLIFEEDEEEAEPMNVYPMPEKREALSPEEFIAIQQANSAILLDVRGEAELKYGVIKNTINIPLYVLETEHKKLPRDKPIVIFCDNGMRALFAYDLLWAKGFKNIRFLNYSVAFEKSGTYRIIQHATQ